jgi:SIR2-like protein
VAKKCNIGDDTEKLLFIESLRKAVQSANLNFIIGAGCSAPSIPLLGNIEAEIQAKIDGGELEVAEKMIFTFLKPFLDCSMKMKAADASIVSTLKNYKSFAANIGKILFERKSNILAKKANIFSTNYDLFMEMAVDDAHIPLRLNDGFCRTPAPWKEFKFSSAEFFNSIYNDGHLYSYEVKVPTINLIKLHGSLNWKANKDGISYSIDHLSGLVAEYAKITAAPTSALISAFNQNISVVLPKKEKFKDVLINQTYYELLRVFANEMDRENTVLIAEGFSFADEHLQKMMERALKNPTLRLVIFCYSKTELAGFEDKFEMFNNVEIVYSEKEDIDFGKFNLILNAILPLAVPSDLKTKVVA